MNDLTPEQIFNRYKKLKINKSTAIKNLDLIIKTNSDNRLRSKALEIIITNFLYESLDMLKWFFENETSQDILFKIYILLENNGDKLSRSVLRLMEEIIGNYYLINYDITSRDAMGLEFLTQLIREQFCASNLEKWHFNRFELKKGKVVSLELECVDTVVTKYVKLFKDLRKLILEDCYLSDFCNMQKLVSLKISGPQVPQINSIDEIEGFEKLINLRELDLSRNEISEIKNLEKCLKLKKLDLSYNYLNEIKCLDFLTELEYLNLSSNGISEIYGLNSLLNLKELDLRENYITEINGFESLVNLKILKLDYNEISVIKGFENLNKLEFLSISNNNLISNSELPPILNESVGVINPQRFVEYCRQKSLRKKLNTLR